MNSNLRFIMSIFSLLAMFSCGTTTTLEEGTFEEQAYTFKSTEYKGFTTNSFEWRFKLGRLPTVEINALTTDWGPPYSDDLYGSTPFVYTAEHRSPYTNVDDYSDVLTSTMLYLSPDRFSKSEFDQYVRFMKLEWPKIDTKHATQPGLRSFPHIIGLVYGEKTDFEKFFKGKKADDGATYDYTIYIDGRIELGNTTGFIYSGLSQKVQMPGKIIYLYTFPESPTSGITLEKLKTYKDKKGKTIPDYFTIVPKVNNQK